jgi:pimeloyl-ACP methyl ester carboxylesterase
MDRSIQRLLVTLVLCLAISLIPRVPARAQDSLPRFEASACPFTPGLGFTEGQNVRCGFLLVPENRARPDSPIIQLAVAIFHTFAPHPAPDPIILLGGGPGDPTVGDLGPALTSINADYFLGDHDLILIDQRGTGFSRPSLLCGQITQAEYQSLSTPQPVGQQVAVETQAYAACHQQLLAAGVDLSAYNTTENAADIADLRTALGYQSVDLLGISYGTRLAQAVMRDHPEGIRSVVLDSVVPPSLNLFVGLTQAFPYAFHLLFHGCAQSPSCHHAYPHLAGLFALLVAQFDAHPITVTVRDLHSLKLYPFAVTGYGFAALLFEAQYITTLIPALPAVVWQTAHRKYRLLRQILTLVGFPLSGESLGMRASVLCSEDAPSTSDVEIADAAATAPDSLRSDLQTVMTGFLHLCALWNVQPAPPSRRAPVTSAIPTLVLDGEYDPITPPSYGATVVATLSHGTRVVFPGTGHSVTFSGSCPDSIVVAFFDQPRQPVDTDCVGDIPEPPFLLPGEALMP